MHEAREPTAAGNSLRNTGPRPNEKSGHGNDQGTLPRLAFYSYLRDPELFELIEFYRTDIELFQRMGYDVRCVTRLRDVIRTRPDIIFAWWWHRSAGVAIWAKIRRIPLVVTGATDFRLPGLRRWKRWTRIALTAFTARFASTNLAISRFELEDLSRVRAPRRKLAYLAVDTDYYAPVGPRSAHPTAAVVAQMNIGSMQRKGVLTAIEAVAELRSRGLALELHLVGEETSEASAVLDELISRLQVADRVVRHGRATRQEKQAILGYCTFYLQPSSYEGFGLAVLEAMAAGSIPVTTQAGSLPEVRGGAGFFIEQQQSDALARCLENAINSPTQTAAQMSAVAQNECRRFSLSSRLQLLSSEMSRLPSSFRPH